MNNTINDSSLLEGINSYWIDSTRKTNYDEIKEDVRVDVAIIGGGIVGITSAYILKKQGFKVAVIEASRIGTGTTGHTTAKVTSQHNLIYCKIINSMGVEKARQYAEANESSIDFVESIKNELNIDCDFERAPSYVYTNDESYINKIEKEVEAASRLGIKAKYTEELPLNYKIKAAVVFENQAQFHPRKYLLPMAEKIPGDGSYIFENTEACELEEGNHIKILTRNGKKVTAPKVIIASHFPFYDGLGLYFARLRPERSYIVGTRINEKFPNAMFINAEKPTRSLRAQRDKEKQLILVGGESHKVAHGEDFKKHYDNLKEFAKSIFDVEDFPYQWSTQDYITIDDVPYVGRLTMTKENIYVATGFGKWGMTNGTTAARIITDMVLDKKNPWKDVYNPSRAFTMKAYKNLIVENFDVAKELIAGKIKQGEDGLKLECGEGKIVELDNNKYGAYKDMEGNIHIVNITCTHVGCELKWNDAEHSWDCPCHGSRFSYDGEILEGPATHKLMHYKEGKNTIDPNL
ncbi:FAD-dependent oxidoreductase [Clostridium paridis]|uniref:FAD-dependent oxidoreductase n=1 Tax=Clostridium paridis TaxID=2803863 RepID=A0A937FEU1_9CLOT|nr:FAD-dependent oxidoreductase [Clostridium paridis]MBL4930992.1 FAD-dependent oxidoreductase [Clostridium paridis]